MFIIDQKKLHNRKSVLVDISLNDTTIFSSESTKQRRLPDNFAESVLTLELQLEKPIVEIQVVNKLVELYAVNFQQDLFVTLLLTQQAVEYYEAIQNESFLLYKNKICKLWTLKNVNMAINKAFKEQFAKENMPPTNQNQSLMKEKQARSYTRKQTLENNISYICQQQQEAGEYQNLLQNKENQQVKILADMKNQNTEIERRIQLRKQKRQLKKSKETPQETPNECVKQTNDQTEQIKKDLQQKWEQDVVQMWLQLVNTGACEAIGSQEEISKKIEQIKQELKVKIQNVTTVK